MYCGNSKPRERKNSEYFIEPAMSVVKHKTKKSHTILKIALNKHNSVRIKRIRKNGHPIMRKVQKILNRRRHLMEKKEGIFPFCSPPLSTPSPLPLALAT